MTVGKAAKQAKAMGYALIGLSARLELNPKLGRLYIMLWYKIEYTTTLSAIHNFM